MQIDLTNSRSRFVANGRLMPEEAAELAASALAAAVARRVSSLLLNLKDLSLTRCMSITECHEAGVLLARAGRGLCKVAFVARPDCMEPHQFVFTVARNRGLQVAAFASESSAVGWLAA
jgi:hypothetical protein